MPVLKLSILYNSEFSVIPKRYPENIKYFLALSFHGKFCVLKLELYIIYIVHKVNNSFNQVIFLEYSFECSFDFSKNKIKYKLFLWLSNIYEQKTFNLLFYLIINTFFLVTNVGGTATNTFKQESPSDLL